MEIDEIVYENQIRNNRYKMCVKQRKADDAISLLLEREEKKNRMATDLQYITWLCGFMKRHPYVDDYPDSIDELMDINEEDFNNIRDIHLFFAMIDNYVANKNGDILRDEDTIYYSVKYNDDCFKIGYLYGQGGMFFVSKADMLEQTIDFNDIMSYYIGSKSLSKKRIKK